MATTMSSSVTADEYEVINDMAQIGLVSYEENISTNNNNINNNNNNSININNNNNIINNNVLFLGNKEIVAGNKYFTISASAGQRFKQIIKKYV